MKRRQLLYVCLFGCILSYSRCHKDQLCKNCDDPQKLAEFNDMTLRFLITEPQIDKARASFFHLDSTSNITTEYKSCIMHEYGVLEDTKIIKASGTIFEPCEENESTYIRIGNYTVIDYCNPSYQIKTGQFTLDNRWEVVSIQTPDTILYVPCEAYPEGAHLTIQQEMISGYTSANAFAGKITITSPNAFEMQNIAVGLIVGTKSENLFQQAFLDVLPPNTQVEYQIQNNVLVIRNPFNNYSIKLFLL